MLSPDTAAVHGTRMRMPFRDISTDRTGEGPVPPVHGADQGSAARTNRAPDQARDGAVSDRPPIAYGIGRKRSRMLATALAMLLAGPPAFASTSPDLEAAHVAAEASVRSGDYRSAAGIYRAILADLGSRRATDAPDREWTRALLQLAVVESTLGHGEASRAAMERVLALDPAARLDPELFSPAFRREFEAARGRVAARPRFRLLVTTRDGSGQGFVQGRPLGPVPVEVRLPAGSYRVGVEAGGETPTITVDLARDETVVVDAVAPAPAPDLAAKAPPVSSTQEPASTGAWMRPTAWATTGLAVVAAGLATWQGIAAAGSYEEAKGMLQPDGSLKPGVDPAAYAAAAASYQSERRNAWIAGGSALLLGAGATVLWLLAPSSAVEPAPGGLAVRF
jgi:hypothetical protein